MKLVKPTTVETIKKPSKPKENQTKVHMNGTNVFLSFIKVTTDRIGHILTKHDIKPIK